MKVGDLVHWTDPQPDVDDLPPEVGIIVEACPEAGEYSVMFTTRPWCNWCLTDELEVINESG